ncbi:phosphatidylserine decarboxylase 1 [Sporobolomyces koalae]|uniref:phosphatidylserine decarboxylase 1 n=1 Tax=Sporobolomyces koalae TaxID=500713 RepID=UPI00316FE9C2
MGSPDMVSPARVPRWVPVLRFRRPNTSASYSTQPVFDAPRPALRKRDLVLRGPALLLRGPGLLLRAPKAVLRAPGAARARTQRLFSSARPLQREQRIADQGIGQPQAESLKGDKGPENRGKASFTSRLRQRWQETPVKWSPIPVSLGAAVLVVLTFYKQASEKGKEPYPEGSVKVQGPWQVHVIGALPLRTISRIYGALNAYTLPVWFRVPGYKFYSWVFGVNLDECDPQDLTEYRSMSEFFMRRLKPGARPIDDAAVVSPADGRIVNFGTIEEGRIASIKGATYSLEALLNGAGDAQTPLEPHGLAAHPHNAEAVSVDEKEFANVNGINYSLDDLMGEHNDMQQQGKVHDASVSDDGRPGAPQRSMSGDLAVAKEIAKGALQPKDGNKLCFAVVYLAPGDYHRYHSPTNWVVEKRRHFAGELFSVSPWMVGKLSDLFVLNERVALLGRWRYGFFSFIPVGATNVGSIRVNFDSSLRTNSPQRPVVPGTYSEATYAQASQMLGGQPLRAGDEIGGFWLGSTIVLVFEAPESFNFNVKNGEKVKVGQALGTV